METSNVSCVPLHMLTSYKSLIVETTRLWRRSASLRFAEEPSSKSLCADVADKILPDLFPVSSLSRSGRALISFVYVRQNRFETLTMLG